MKLFCAALLIAAAARAQEQAPDPKALLTDAILHYRAQTDRVATVDIRHGKPRGQAGGFNFAVRIGPGGRAGKLYEGRARIWRDPDGATVVTSPQGELPAFKLYVARDGSAVRQVTYSEDDGALNLDTLEHELVSLLDPDRFMHHIMAAKDQMQVRVDPTTGDATFSGPIDPEIAEAIPPRLPPGIPAVAVQQVIGMFPQNLLLKATATLVVTKQGRFKSAAITFTRNDPNQEMMRRWKNRKGGVRVVIGGPGGQAPPAPPPPNPGGADPDDNQQGKEKKADEKPIEGGTTTYTLTFDNAEPSDAAKAFKREVARLAGE